MKICYLANAGWSGRRFNIETAYIIYEEYETRYKPIIG